MFKQSKYAMFILALIASFTVIQTMQVDKFKVAVRNNFGAEIVVEYTYSGKLVKRKVTEKADLILGDIRNLSGEIKIYRAGDWLGRVSYLNYKVEVNALAQAWHQINKPLNSDVLLLVVNPDSKIGFMGASEEQLKIRAFGQTFEGDVLDQFPDLKKYDLQKKLTPDRVLAIQSYNEIVIPGGWVSGATTGEDIARYILGLPKGYNADSVNRAYRELALKWHPDNQKIEGMKAFAQKVFPVIKKAQEILSQALDKKT